MSRLGFEDRERASEAGMGLVGGGGTLQRLLGVSKKKVGKKAAFPSGIHVVFTKNTHLAQIGRT